MYYVLYYIGKYYVLMFCIYDIKSLLQLPIILYKHLNKFRNVNKTKMLSLPTRIVQY